MTAIAEAYEEHAHDREARSAVIKQVLINDQGRNRDLQLVED